MQIYIETYGCSSNRSDSEIMAGLLTRAGFYVVSSIDLADVVVVNTCIVKSTTENKIVDRIKQISRDYPTKKLIIAGCMPEAEHFIAKQLSPYLVSTNYITDIVKAVEKAVNNKDVELIGKEKKEKICLPKMRKNSILDIVEICSGCNNSCSYCITKFAKGSLFCYSPEKVIQEIEGMHNSGVKEFWITGQDIAAYDYEGMGLPQLIEKITEEVKGRYFIRLGMMNPSSVLPILNDLIRVYQNKNVFKFLHLPLQSGSDRVLNIMNRNYKVKSFRQIVSEFRKAIPELTLWTDIIVGFPNEDDNDFRASVVLLKEIKPDFTNISQFGSRPGTKAASMKQLSSEIKKERSRKITEVVDSICLEKNESWLEWSGPALIDEYNRSKQNWIARNSSYKPIVLKGRYKLGQMLDVNITDVKKTCLIGSERN